MQGKSRRPIRSYVIRSGRITPAQQRAVEALWPLYGIEVNAGTFHRESVFGRRAELTVEIGFGMGECLLEMAGREPHGDFVGIEVHPPGVGALLRGLREKELDNVRVYREDAADVLSQCFPDGEIERILIFFPDPWPKKRHHKRRLIQPPFVQLLHRKLAAGGIVHLATDWQNYAEHIQAVMSAADGFRNTAGPGCYARDHDRPLTKFERRGRKLGHQVWDLVFVKTPETIGSL